MSERILKLNLSSESVIVKSDLKLKNRFIAVTARRRKYPNVQSMP